MPSSSFIWAGRLARASAQELGSIRLIRGLEALVIDEAVWVRGPRLGAEEEKAVARIPWEMRCELLDGGRLRMAGHRLSDGSLPNGTWRPLTELLAAGPLAVSRRVRVPATVAFELRPGAAMRDPAVIEVSAEDWKAFVETAPEIRLLRLTFAFDTAHPERVLIRGTPLPPIRGIQFVEAEAVATPAGWTWWPAVSAATLRAALEANDGELVVLRAGSEWSRVPRTAWIAATRSAVRAVMGVASGVC